MSLVARCSLLALLAACSDKSDEAPPPPGPEPEEVEPDQELPELPACQPDGEPTLFLGTGGRAGFTPFIDGELLPIEADATGIWGFYVDLLSAGLDTTEPVTAMLRFSLDDDPTTEDAGARLAMQCPDGGFGWAGVFVPLDDSLQDEAELAAIDGLPLYLTAMLTDWTGETATAELALVLAAPQ